MPLSLEQYTHLPRQHRLGCQWAGNDPSNCPTPPPPCHSTTSHLHQVNLHLYTAARVSPEHCIVGQRLPGWHKQSLFPTVENQPKHSG